MFFLFVGVLSDFFGLKLVGLYDILFGLFDDISELDIILYYFYWRYYYDLLEFLIVLKGDDKIGYYVGYYR